MKTAYVITKPNGHVVTIGEYVRSWKQLLTMPANAEVSDWEWYPVTVASILSDIRRGIFDRINQRGKIKVDWPEPCYARIHRELERRVAVDCRWCGTKMIYRPVHDRFCCDSCRHDYNS